MFVNAAEFQDPCTSVEKRVTRNKGVNPTDLLVYENIAKTLDLDPHHSFEDEVEARALFIRKCELLTCTTVSTDIHFITPHGIFYKRYIIVKSMKESRAEKDFAPGSYTTPIAAAKEIRSLVNNNNLPVVCFVGGEITIKKNSVRHCWCVCFWKEDGKVLSSVKDSNSGAKVPQHARDMAVEMAIPSILLIPATNRDMCSEKDCVQLTYDAMSSVLDGTNPKTFGLSKSEIRTYLVSSKKFA